MSEVMWASLQRGDKIICPQDGKPEEIIQVLPYARGTRRRVVTRHDVHVRFPTERVEKVEEIR
jgi:hypothetical protein